MPVLWIVLVDHFLPGTYHKRFDAFENGQSIKSNNPCGVEETFLPYYQTSFRRKTVECIEFINDESWEFRWRIEETT